MVYDNSWMIAFPVIKIPQWSEPWEQPLVLPAKGE